MLELLHALLFQLLPLLCKRWITCTGSTPDNTSQRCIIPHQKLTCTTLQHQ
jgi:hypothetical protein